MTATITAPATVTLTVSLESMTKAQLTAHILATRLFTAPVSWTKAKLIEAAKGELSPRSGKVKAQLVAAYTVKVGIAPAKSWTCKKLNAEVVKDAPALPRGKASKDAAVAAYIAATGYLPAKSWTVAIIVDRTRTRTLPARNAVKADAPVALPTAA